MWPCSRRSRREQLISSLDLSMTVGNGTQDITSIMAEERAAKIIDGKAVAAAIREEIRVEVESLPSPPGLAVVLVGDREDSATYVRMKIRACEAAGITSFKESLPADTTQEALVDAVRRLNEDDSVHGILIQLPLPEHIDEEAVLAEVALSKDVDGLHPENAGRLAMRGREPLFMPCTPMGCIELLDRSGVEIEGRSAVVLGRSNIVGIPVSHMLMKRNATVTICHSKTTDVEERVRGADILVASCGIPQHVKGEWLKEGAVVLDVGINAIPDASKKSGRRLVGDVDFESASKVASAITPVPGGIGPMTIAMLLRNTLKSARRFLL
eukprot:PLAT9826.1.p2 GENE.PLAT9826.1~~PLAT9826.1.p2  ORF type:complete len:326 (-),score=137.80 PLAT9826.1:199-1176(-)